MGEVQQVYGLLRDLTYHVEAQDQAIGTVDRTLEKRPTIE